MNTVSFLSTYIYVILGIMFFTGASIIITKTREKTDVQLKKVAKYFNLEKINENKFIGIFKDRKITMELFKQGSKIFLNISTEFKDQPSKKGMYFSMVLSNENGRVFDETFTIVGDKIPNINSSIKSLLITLKNKRYFTKRSVLMGFYHNKPEVVFITEKTILSDINAVKEILEIEHMLAKSMEEMKEFTKVVL